MKQQIHFEDLFQETLADIYDAERQIAAALPKMIAASSAEELSAFLESHLEETKEHISRLDDIFERIAVQPDSTECKPMQALLSEGARLISTYEKSAALDVALIAAAQKVEHYEISSYNAASALAETLSQQDAFDLLQETLEEETDADATLGEICDSILTGDADTEIEEEVEEEDEVSETES
jgi:ferritin-like metal-binding protein YciE